ncbi:MAG: hypothetical protein FJ087_21315 [Deltaproteobacteria bacterium]|nr:hypothetical protein [Deltaproteobacteria bacterium]
MTRTQVLLLLASIAPGAALADSVEAAPAPADLVAAFSAIPPDPPPKELCADAHFVKSDEEAHWLFKGAVTGLGGVFVGLGTDQNYVMAGWARPDVLVPADFDQVVVDVHRLYGIAFLASPDATAFVRAWTAPELPAFEERVRRAFEDPAARARMLKALRYARPFVEMRLRWMLRAYRKHKVAFFLSDPDQYRFVASLWRANRVFPVRGDLTGDKAFAGIAAAASKAGLPVRALYLSNAEKYFDYNKGFNEAMRAMPFDDRSVVLRTAGGWHVPDPKGKDPDPLYIFLVQQGMDFKAWIRDVKPRGWKPLIYQRKKTDVRGLYTIPGPGSRRPGSR